VLKRIDRRVLFVAIGLVALVGLTMVMAPRGEQISSGSSYARQPDGYGAWYASVEQAGGKIQRWQKPAEDFFKTPGTGKTFLQVDPRRSAAYLGDQQRAWVENGNTLIFLGKQAPATNAPFSGSYPTKQGQVKIETTRRRVLTSSETEVLRDRVGAIVWKEKKGKGQVIYSVTPFLAANAYQDEPGNFALLTQLAKQQGNPIWVDEYLHGYMDQEVIEEEIAGSWQQYLMETPWLAVLVQLCVLVGVLIFAKNRRFGQPMPLETQAKDSNATYIQALAGVLRKANRSDFVVDAIARAEQIQIQKALGLGNRLLDVDVVVKAWMEQTGRSGQELEQILRSAKQQNLSEADLLVWLEQIRQVRQQLPS
jgi:Domain of unknown function (DUF4350)